MKKLIPGYDNYYATPNGDIYYLDSQVPKTKRVHKGYYEIRLRVKGKTLYKLLHRLIAITFINNPDNLPQVNHIDCNKLNNDISNLEWCTGEQNMHHAKINGRFKRKSKPTL